MKHGAGWKNLERRHARRFTTGVRLWRPDFSDSQPDGESDTDIWDTKYRQSFSVVRLFLECERKYKAWAPGKRFHLCLHDARHQGDYVLLRADDYADLVKEAYPSGDS